MKNFKFLLLFATILIFNSCAGMKKKTKPEPKSYGSDVENEFSSIENDQRRVLEYYRTLREKNWEDYRKGDNLSQKYKKQFKKPRIVKMRPAPAPKPEVKPLADSEIEEMKIEIRQYQNYFCMENRKSSRFSDKADCSAYTENVYSNCEKKFPIISDRSLVNCVKRGLR